MDTNQNTTNIVVNQAATLLNVESLIKNYNARLETLTKESREFKEMLQNSLENDPEYVAADKEAKKTAKVKSVAKQKVLKNPSVAEVVDKIKDHQHQIKELKSSLSDYLAQYLQMAGTNQIEDVDGTLLEIIYSAHLVKKQN